MKKNGYFTALAFCALLLFPAVLSAADAQAPKQEAPKVVSPKEYVAAEMPKEVNDLVNSVSAALPTDERYYYSGAVEGVNDYLLVVLATDIGEIKVLAHIGLTKDEKGHINPGERTAETVALVFTDQKVSWFKDPETKRVFQEATK